MSIEVGTRVETGKLTYTVMSLPGLYVSDCEFTSQFAIFTLYYFRKERQGPRRLQGRHAVLGRRMDRRDSGRAQGQEQRNRPRSRVLFVRTEFWTLHTSSAGKDIVDASASMSCYCQWSVIQTCKRIIYIFYMYSRLYFRKVWQ